MSEFPKEGYEFFRELAVNNNREWFESHKKDYEKFVKQPGSDFVDELAELVSREFGEEFGAKIYRIYRDVRFSKDKTPYNPYFRVTLMPVRAASKAKPGCDRAALHFSVETGEVIAGCGMFGFEGAQLTHFRNLVADEKSGTELVSILDDLKLLGGRMDEPELKRVPARNDPGHARADLLRRKSLAIWIHDRSPQDAGAPVSAVGVVEMFARCRPLYRWMQKLN